MPDPNAIVDYLRDQGRDDKYITEYLHSEGVDPSGVSGIKQGPMPDVAAGADVAERDATKQYLGAIGHDVSDETASKLVKYGALPAIKAREWGASVLDWTSFHGTQAAYRTKNMLELTVGALGSHFLRPQQALFAGLMGKPRDEIIKKIIPEFTDENVADHTPFMNSMEQLIAMGKAGAHGDWDKFGQLMDTNPVVMEEMDKQLRFQDVMEKVAGGKDKFDAILANMQSGPQSTAKIAGMALLSMGGDIGLDPMWAADVVPAIITKGAWALRGGEMLDKVLASGKAVRSVGDALETQRFAQKFRDVAAAMHETEGSAKTARKLAVAEKRLAEANTIVDSKKAGPVIDIALRKMEKAKPETDVHVEVFGEPDNPFHAPYVPADGSDAATFPMLTQRATLGPDDAEAAGDALRFMTEGGEMSDVRVPVQTSLEYAATPRYQAPTMWLQDVHTKASAAREAGTHAQQMMTIFPERGMPSLMGRFVNPLRMIDQGLWTARQPRNSLMGTGIFERARGATANYEIEAGAVAEKFLGALKNAGIVKKSWYGTTQVISPERNEALFNLLDAPKDTPQELQAFKDLYASHDEGLQKAYHGVRSWLDDIALRQGISPDMRATGYATHLFPPELFAEGARPPEFTGLPATADLFVAHLLDRTGKLGYARDAVNMLEVYTRAALRKIHIEPALQDMLDIAAADGRKHIMNYTDDLVREMKGTPVSVDQAVDRMVDTAARTLGTIKPGSSARASLAVSAMYYSSLLAGNVSYLIKNVATGMLNPLAQYGALNTLHGLFQMGTEEGRALARTAGVDRQYARIFEGNGFKAFSDLASKFGPEQTEFYNRGLSFHAALSDNIRRSGKSWSELKEMGLAGSALHDAVMGAEFTQHVYGVMGRSPMVTRALGKTLYTPAAQFLSFAPKQAEFLLSMTKDNPGYLMRYLAYSGITQRIAAQELNIDASDFVGFGFLPNTKRDELLPKSPALSLLTTGIDHLAAIKDGDPTKMEQTGRDFDSQLTNFIPGIQAMKKTTDAISRLATGEINKAGGFERNVQTNELPAVVLQMPSIQDQRQRQILEQGQQKIQNMLWERTHAAEQLVDAIEKGDTAGADKVAQRLGEMGIPMSGDGVARIQEARMLSRTMRFMQENKFFMGFFSDVQLQNTPGFGEVRGETPGP